MSDNATESVVNLAPAATLNPAGNRYDGTALFAWLARIRLAHRYQGSDPPANYLAAFADETGITETRLRDLLDPTADTGPASDAANPITTLLAMELGEEAPERTWQGEQVARVAPDDGTVWPQVGPLVRAHVRHLQDQGHNRNRVRGAAVSGDELSGIISGRGGANPDAVRRLLEHWQSTFEANTPLPGLVSPAPAESRAAAPESLQDVAAPPAAITPTVTDQAATEPAMAGTPALPSHGRSGAKLVSPDLPDDHIGRWIDTRLRESGLSQQEFAVSIDMSSQYVSMYRRGVKPVPPNVVKKIIRVYSPGTDFDELKEKFKKGHSAGRGAKAQVDAGKAAVTGNAAALPTPRVPRFTAITDATSDATFEAHVDSLLTGLHQATRDAGWAQVARIVRRERIAAGRLMEQQVAEHGEIARIIEAGGGHESHAQLAEVLALARALGGTATHDAAATERPDLEASGEQNPNPSHERGRISTADLDLVQRTIGNVARIRLEAAAARLVASQALFHFEGWGRSQWPPLAAYLTAARELRGQSLTEAAAELGVPVAAVREIEHGGAYDPAFPVSGSPSDERIDLRPVAARLLQRAAEFEASSRSDHGISLVGDDRISVYEQLLATERTRDHHSYRNVLESRTPTGAESWRNLAVEVYQSRRRGRLSREGLATGASTPVSVVSGLETGASAGTYRGFYDVQRLTSRLFAGTNPATTELLAEHHSWLTHETVERLKANPQPPFDSWAASGLPELGVALLDAREREGLTQSGLAKRCGATKWDIAEAEEGFSAPDAPSEERVRRVAHELGFTEQTLEAHAAALAVLVERESLAKSEDTETTEARGKSGPLTDSDLVSLADAYDSGITPAGGRAYLLNAPRAGRVQWGEKGLLTVLASDLPPEVGSPPGADKYLHVYLRAAGVPALLQDPVALARLEAAIAHWDHYGEESRLRLRVLPAEHDDAFPHDFGILAGRHGTTFVALNHQGTTPYYDAVDVTELLVDPKGIPLETVERRPMTAPNYAGELTTRLGLVTGARHNPGAELSFWSAVLDRVRASRAAPLRATGIGRLAGTPPESAARRRPGRPGAAPKL